MIQLHVIEIVFTLWCWIIPYLGQGIDMFGSFSCRMGHGCSSTNDLSNEKVAPLWELPDKP